MSDLKSICALLESRQYGLLTSNNLSENDGPTSASNTTGLIQNDLIQTMCSKLKNDKDTTNSWSTVLTSYILVKYCYPLLLLFGLSGNALTFLVMCRVHCRKRNFQKFSLSLGTLALADLAILIFGCLVEYLDEVAGISLKTFSVASCKLTLFACYLFSCYSAYLHAFIAVERWHAISSPLTSITRFTFKTNRLILGIVFLLCILINLPLLWFPSINQLIQLDNSNSIGVRIVEECQIAQDTILFLIDSLFYCLVPFFLTILFSMLTLVKLIRIRSSTSGSGGSGGETPRPRSPDDVSKVMISGASAAAANPVCTINGTTATTNTGTGNYSPTRVHIVHNKGSSASFTSNRLKVYKLTSASINSHSSGKSNVKLTLMLMALPISYLVTTFPIFLIVVHGILVNNNLLPDHLARPLKTNFQLVYALAKIFMYVNNSINILFYIVFGKNLRKDFVALLTSPLNCFGLMPMKKRFKRSSDHRFHSLTNYDQQDVRFVAQQQQANNHHRQSGSLRRIQ